MLPIPAPKLKKLVLTCQLQKRVVRLGKLAVNDYPFRFLQRADHFVEVFPEP